MVTNHPSALNLTQSSCNVTQTGRTAILGYVQVNEIDSAKWNSISGNSSAVQTQQEPAPTVSVQQGVNAVLTTGKCSKIPGDVTPSSNTQGICETIAGNMVLNPIKAID